MPKKIDYIKDSVVRNYIKQVAKLHPSNEALDELNTQINTVITSVLSEAAKRARKARVKTILIEQMREGLEKHVGKKLLDWDEIVEQIMQQAPADMGKITKDIRARIRELDRKTKR